jgi:hypothetical protein
VAFLQARYKEEASFVDHGEGIDPRYEANLDGDLFFSNTIEDIMDTLQQTEAPKMGLPKRGL